MIPMVPFVPARFSDLCTAGKKTKNKESDSAVLEIPRNSRSEIWEFT